MPCGKIKKQLKKLLETDGISGYSIRDKVLTIYVENKQAAEMLNLAAFEGYEVKIVEVGRFSAL
jgi:hypothetical protein